MIYQLREYTVKPGEMEEWIAEWRSKVVPLRRKHGFDVLGAWTVDGTDQFVWIIGYGGAKSWKEADAGYYASPERKAMDPDPARHLAQTGARMMTSVTRPSVGDRPDKPPIFESRQDDSPDDRPFALREP